MAQLVTTHILSRSEQVLIRRCASQISTTIGVVDPSTTTMLSLATCYLENANHYDRTRQLRRAMRVVLQLDSRTIQSEANPLRLLSYPTYCAESLMRIWTACNPINVYCLRMKDIILCCIEYLRRRLFLRQSTLFGQRRRSLAQLGRRDARAPLHETDDDSGYLHTDYPSSGESMC